MRVQISARHCDVDDPVRERTREQMVRLRRYDSRVSAADVVFKEEKRVRIVEAVLSMDGSDPVVAHGAGEDFRVAVDQVVDRLARILRRRRGRDRDHQVPRPVQAPASD